MPCMCGDTYCWSCGPAQGNYQCDNCGNWLFDTPPWRLSKIGVFILRLLRRAPCGCTFKSLREWNKSFEESMSSLDAD